jgi:hypothetical protein
MDIAISGAFEQIPQDFLGLSHEGNGICQSVNDFEDALNTASDQGEGSVTEAVSQANNSEVHDTGSVRNDIQKADGLEDAGGEGNNDDLDIVVALPNIIFSAIEGDVPESGHGSLGISDASAGNASTVGLEAMDIQAKKGLSVKEAVVEGQAVGLPGDLDADPVNEEGPGANDLLNELSDDIQGPGIQETGEEAATSILQKGPFERHSLDMPPHATASIDALNSLGAGEHMDNQGAEADPWASGDADQGGADPLFKGDDADIKDMSKAYTEVDVQGANLASGAVLKAERVSGDDTNRIDLLKESLLNAVDDGVKQSISGNSNAIKLRLHPEGLGDMTIRLAFKGDSSIEAILTVGDEAAKSLLDSDAKAIREIFSRHGLMLEDYTVKVSEVGGYGGFEGTAHEGAGRGGFFNAWGRGVFGDAVAESKGMASDDPVTVQGAYSTRASGEGIDIFI